MIMDKTKNRGIGCFVGLVCGDCLGTTIEFEHRDTYEHLTDIVGGGPFNVPVGGWTDDTSMALCLADSLVEKGDIDAYDIALRFYRWFKKGENSHTGKCFDIGRQTARSLAAFGVNDQPLNGPTDERASGNGSIMRLAPVPMFWHDDLESALIAAEIQSKITHGSQSCLDACADMTTILHHLINDTKNFDEMVNVEALKAKPRHEISSSGYVVHTLEAAKWSVANTDNFKDAVLLAANLGDDADTVAAVAGQFAGAIYGLSGIPEEWVNKILWKDHILELSSKLMDTVSDD